MDGGISFEKKPKAQIHFDRRDWLALLGALICAAGYAFLHPSMFDSAYTALPGIGLTFSCWAMLAICMGYIGWKNLNWSALSGFLLAATVALSLTFGIYSNESMRIMNQPVLLALSVLAVFSLRDASLKLDGPQITALFRHSIPSLVESLPAPVYGLRGFLRSENKRPVKELLLGLGICIPVVGFLLWMLCDADRIFGVLVGGMFDGIFRQSGSMLFVSLLRLAVLAPLLFAFVYSLQKSIPAHEKKIHFRLPEITLITVLLAVCILYSAFVFVQCRYLFAGKDAALMEGGYATYARSGFFQLVIVGILTLLLVLPPLSAQPKLPVRLLCGLVSLMTMVIVFSAFWRMRLYIRAFGLTLLRLVTLWGILAVFAAMLAALAKAFVPKLRIFRILFIFTACSWITLNYMNVDACIAKYNVDAYRSGTMETLDCHYLSLLSPDALPALEGLKTDDPVLRSKLREAQEDILAGKPCAYDWSLNWLKAN